MWCAKVFPVMRFVFDCHLSTKPVVNWCEELVEILPALDESKLEVVDLRINEKISSFVLLFFFPCNIPPQWLAWRTTCIVYYSPRCLVHVWSVEIFRDDLMHHLATQYAGVSGNWETWFILKRLEIPLPESSLFMRLNLGTMLHQTLSRMELVNVRKTSL